MFRHPFTLIIHIALSIILAGAFVTHYLGVQGELVLVSGAPPATSFHKTSGPGDATFPFAVSLIDADIDFYPGTTTPMDFHSLLLIDADTVSVSMNSVGEVDGWRFFQSGISPDDTTLSVCYDPWGIGITYTGYALLLISMIGYIFQPRTPWRSLFRYARTAVVAALICVSLTASASSSSHGLPVMQSPLAANLGKAYVYWNDRICPLQTMARDVAQQLYGSTSYRGLTSEQILSGWLFYYDAWERDYTDNILSASPSSPKDSARLDKSLALIRWLGSGEAFRIYPYHSAAGEMQWLSLTGRRPSQMPLSQWIFITSSMPHIKQLLIQGRNIAANEAIAELIEAQIKYAGHDFLPSQARMTAERYYNRYASLAIPGAAAFLLAILTMYAAFSSRKFFAKFIMALRCVCALLFAYLVAIVALLWWIGGHVPVSNGSEMMLVMALVGSLAALILHSRMLSGACLIVTASTLIVGAISSRAPQIGLLVPVLSSPLLSVHVMLVLTAYVFFIIMALLAVIGLAVRSGSPTSETAFRYNRIILLPAVFSLAAGIFVGAVWANQSWGRYWGWDPKETCALVMLLVYSVPLHWASRPLRVFRRPKVMQCYLLIAILTVAFTYFGANYFLTGLHSYA